MRKAEELKITEKNLSDIINYDEVDNLYLYDVFSQRISYDEERDLAEFGKRKMDEWRRIPCVNCFTDFNLFPIINNNLYIEENFLYESDFEIDDNNYDYINLFREQRKRVDISKLKDKVKGTITVKVCCQYGWLDGTENERIKFKNYEEFKKWYNDEDSKHPFIKKAWSK